MRGAPATIEVLRPRGAREAVRAYGRAPGALPLAGGTDVMVAWNAGLLNGRTVLDLSAVGEWTKIERRAGGLRIGALVTHARLRDSAAVRRLFPRLAEACATVGAAAIQNRGTLGGNVANASPAGDTFPPLSVYEASVHAVSPQGRRVLPLSGFFAGVKRTILGPSELIEAIEIPMPARPPSRGLFRKVGTRAAQAISKTVAAGLLWTAKDGTIAELRFALGSVAPTVRRLRTVEAFAAGKRPTPEVIEEACALLAKDVSPIDDIRSTAAYRVRVSQNILRAFLKP